MSTRVISNAPTRVSFLWRQAGSFKESSGVRQTAFLLKAASKYLARDCYDSTDNEFGLLEEYETTHFDSISIDTLFGVSACGIDRSGGHSRTGDLEL
jgi:hypothetical protein